MLGPAVDTDGPGSADVVGSDVVIVAVDVVVVVVVVGATHSIVHMSCSLVLFESKKENNW